MAVGKEIKARIKSVKNTGKITKAMELISTVKMKKAQENTLGARPFVLEASMLVSLLDFKKDHHPKTDKQLVLVIASNKGLCGGYNVNIFKEIALLLNSHPKKSYDFVTVGKRAREFVLRTGNTLVADFSDTIKDTVDLTDVKDIRRLLVNLYKGGEYEKVTIVYSHYISAITQKPIIKTLLPAKKSDIMDFFEYIGHKAPPAPTVEFEFEPSPEAVAEAVLPIIYDAIIRESLLEAKASEHAARMVAMKNAKDSANKKVRSLTLTYNKARQAAITKEVSEIVSGVESMKE